MVIEFYQKKMKLNSFSIFHKSAQGRLVCANIEAIK